MTWLSIIGVALRGIASLVAILQERQLLKAGEAKAIADALTLSNTRVAEALAARRRARDGDPDPHDPYLRD